MSRSSYGKPLKGVGSLSARFTGPIEDAILQALSTGGIPLENVSITGGTIDGVTIGTNTPGPGIFTTLQTGTPAGLGYQVCFYGQSVGDSACWEPVLGRWNIQGDLLVRDISDLGNLRIVGNRLSSTNTNGNIIIDPDGTGIISLVGPVTQSTTNGDVTFNTSNGLYTLTTGETITTTSGTDTFTRTNDGDIVLQTGLSIITSTINDIGSGPTPTVTTELLHGLEVGDTVVINGTNSTPDINGVFEVISVPTSSTFVISPGFVVTGSGDTGSVYKHNDIFLSATNNVNIPVDVGLTFGSDTQNIKGNGLNEITVSTAGDINLSPAENYDINIPVDIGLTFGGDNHKIESDGTDITVDVGSGELVVNGDLRVNGTTTTIKSTVTTLDDPVITLGGDSAPTIDDNKDRGVEFLWHTGSEAKAGFFGRKDSTGCFTYIPDATNTSEVFTGTPGCAEFGALTGTSLNLQGGPLLNIGFFQACDISCPGTMTITADTALNLTTPIVTSTGALTSSGNFTANGETNTIGGTVLNITSENVLTDDGIITIGGVDVPISNDLEDRGIEFRYHDGVSDKLGFFGWDESENCFTFLTDAVNTDGVMSGVLGDVCFGAGNFSSINTCDINCPGDLNISGGTSITLTSPSTTITGNLTANGDTNTISGESTHITSTSVLIDDPVITIGGVEAPLTNDLKDKGIEFRYHDGVSAKTAFFGWDESSNCFTFLQDTSNVDNVITGTKGDACFGDTDVTNLNVTGEITGFGVSTIFTKEHLSASGGGIITPDSDINITFVSVTSSGTATGTLAPATIDGFQKHIMMSSMVSGSKYEIALPTGRMLDPGTGSSVAKKLTFEYTGQSIFLIWDADIASYIPVNGGVCISSV